MNRMWIAPIAAVAVIVVLLMSTAVGLGQGASNGPANAVTAAPNVVSGSVGSSVSAGTCGQSHIPLGAASAFRILAGTTITNTGNTVVKGSIGVSPGSSVTGFPPGKVTGAIDKADTAAANAEKALTTAYNNGMGRSNCAVSVAGNIGGKTLTPGLYHSSSSLSISSGDLTLNANGHSNGVFIFQTVSKFTMTSGRHVILAGGAQAANIYWVVGSSATLGSTAFIFGNILAHKSISLATGAILHGRALARIGGVTMQDNRIVFDEPMSPTTLSHSDSSPLVARTYS
jgi:hypothetical protein